MLHHDDVKAVNTEENPQQRRARARARAAPLEGEQALGDACPELSWNVLRLRHV